MRIVLREDVEKLGTRGDVVTVANGYARNYLLPQKMAFLATGENLKRVEKDAEVWLYDNQFCNAHVYFYENDNSDLQVEYIETSEEKNLMGLQGQRADFCISTFLRD